MQREYIVEVKEQLSIIEHIKAESIDEAVDIVKKMYYSEKIGIIELVYIVLQSVVKPGITGFFKIDLHIKCYIYLS